MHFGFCHAFGQGRKSCREYALIGGRAVLHQRRRRVRCHAVADELSADNRQAHEPHVDNDRLPGLDQMFPVEGDRAIPQMAGNEHAALRVVAVGQRNARIGSTACRCRNAGDDLKGDPFASEGFDLLATAPEDESSVYEFGPGNSMGSARLVVA